MAVQADDRQLGGRYLELVGNSVTLAAVTALLAVALGTLMAYGRRLQGTPVVQLANRLAAMGYAIPGTIIAVRSEEHTSDLQSLMRSSYAGFCLKKKIHHTAKI